VVHLVAVYPFEERRKNQRTTHHKNKGGKGTVLKVLQHGASQRRSPPSNDTNVQGAETGLLLGVEHEKRKKSYKEIFTEIDTQRMHKKRERESRTLARSLSKKKAGAGWSCVTAY